MRSTVRFRASARRTAKSTSPTGKNGAARSSSPCRRLSTSSTTRRTASSSTFSPSARSSRRRSWPRRAAIRPILPAFTSGTSAPSPTATRSRRSRPSCARMAPRRTNSTAATPAPTPTWAPIAGDVWAVPSTPTTTAFYWNKDLFRAAGLDPEKPPRTLAELVAMSKKLTLRDAAGNLTQVGFLPQLNSWRRAGLSRSGSAARCLTGKTSPSAPTRPTSRRSRGWAISPTCTARRTSLT